MFIIKIKIIFLRRVFMKSSKILLNIMSVVCFIFGAVYCFTLVLLPIGIYCFIAAKRFSFRADNLFDVYVVPNKIIKKYAIFASIVCFPIGLLCLVAYNLIASNNVSVEEIKNNAGLHHSEEKTSDEVTPAQVQTVMTEKEKNEKFEKLQNFRDKGIITDDELEMAREQLFGKNEK